MLRSLTYGQQLVSVHGTVVSSLPALAEVEETARRYESAARGGGHDHTRRRHAPGRRSASLLLRR